MPWSFSVPGDVLELEDGIVSIGSGGPYALAACRAMVAESKLSAEQIVKRSLEIAADICIIPIATSQSSS